MGTIQGYISGMVICTIVSCCYVVVSILVGVGASLYRAWVESQE